MPANVNPRWLLANYRYQRYWLLHEALRYRVAGDVRGRRAVQKQMVRERKAR